MVISVLINAPKEDKIIFGVTKNLLCGVIAHLIIWSNNWNKIKFQENYYCSALVKQKMSWHSSMFKEKYIITYFYFHGNISYDSSKHCTTMYIHIQSLKIYGLWAIIFTFFRLNYAHFFTKRRTKLCSKHIEKSFFILIISCTCN